MSPTDNDVGDDANGNDDAPDDNARRGEGGLPSSPVGRRVGVGGGGGGGIGGGYHHHPLSPGGESTSNVSLPSLSNFPPEHREELRKMYLAGFRDAAAKKAKRAVAAAADGGGAAGATAAGGGGGGSSGSGRRAGEGVDRPGRSRSPPPGG